MNRTVKNIAYGETPQQYGVLTLPGGTGDVPYAVVAFIHGGFWRNAFDLSLAEPQVADAVAHGYATWNIEYRRVGDSGGGYPGTLNDISVAIDHLAKFNALLDLDAVTVVGHSAGGHLALWAGQRTNPLVSPRLVVGQAPVVDFGRSMGLGDGAIEAFMGGPAEALPAAYAVADPARLLPVKVPQLIVQGKRDTRVPAEVVAPYAVEAGKLVTYVEYEFEDHFSIITVDSIAWHRVRQAIAEPGRDDS